MSGAVPRLHVEIEADLHRRAKVVAALRDLTMKRLITEAVEAYVERAEAEGQR
jgi:predicted transcriptional regulator